MSPFLHLDKCGLVISVKGDPSPSPFTHKSKTWNNTNTLQTYKMLVHNEILIFYVHMIFCHNCIEIK